MGEKKDIIYIEHILDSINAIEDFSEELSKEELKSNRLKQSTIVREIEIIGEAVKNISKNLKNKHPEVEWQDIAGTRDKIIHHYFGLDLNIIWDIVTKDLKILKKKTIIIRDSLKKEIIFSVKLANIIFYN